MSVTRRSAVAGLAAAAIAPAAAAADARVGSDVERVVQETIRPLMAEHAVPGMAVGVTAAGQRRVLSYGLASRETGREVDGRTLFEIGSVSKVFTATLGAYAAERGAFSLSDPASRHMPALRGGVFDAITPLELATYTAGGLPLQFPDEVADEASMVGFFRSWRPRFPAGERRVYSNPSAGLFGRLAASSLDAPFGTLMEKTLLPMLGLENAFVVVPPARADHYATGYAGADRPIRVAPGMLDAEAYGLKITASDLVGFVEAHIDGAGLDPSLARAMAATRLGRFQAGALAQGLGWEIYDEPLDLDRLLAGNGPGLIFEAVPAKRLDPPADVPDALLNKTGSTNGFGCYVAFRPARRVGVALLANRNYPIPARVKAAHKILTALDRG